MDGRPGVFIQSTSHTSLFQASHAKWGLQVFQVSELNLNFRFLLREEVGPSWVNFKQKKNSNARRCGH